MIIVLKGLITAYLQNHKHNNSNNSCSLFFESGDKNKFIHPENAFDFPDRFHLKFISEPPVFG